ncbi:MAG: hypothetical protein HY343_01120, partial [Lentisphaerae bacterium]|nr:hypothetical protein [Lentisphaerota bacterium]
AAPRPAEDIFGAEPTAPAGADAAVPGAGRIPEITLNLRNITLVDALKYITEVTSLKYRIEESAVIITPSDVVWGEVITRMYSVQPSIQETILTRSDAGATSGELGTGVTATRSDVSKFFQDAGVPFPQGTSIIYKPSIGKLIVANTAENLEKFESILAKLNVIPSQVEIEAKFVEIDQTDLEEIGMQWILSDDWELAQNASSSAPITLGNRERIQANRTSTSMLRTLGDVGGSAVAESPNIPGQGESARGALGSLFSLSSVLTNPEVTFILHLLNQSSTANLLSAPKVTTKSGMNAEIKIVRELIYPTQFEQTSEAVGTGAAGATGAAGTTTRVVVTPSGFEKRDVGVILNVTPVVGPDGYTIDLTMLPQVVELVDWVNYGSTVTTTDSSGNPQTESRPMPQPVFNSRNITTSISIWDGETVVMGGLISEGQTDTHDKIPFLGDLPLIGRFFRSDSSRTVKRNLLIFVTANLVDPAGNKIAQPEVAPAEPKAPGAP